MAERRSAALAFGRAGHTRHWSNPDFNAAIDYRAAWQKVALGLGGRSLVVKDIAGSSPDRVLLSSTPTNNRPDANVAGRAVAWPTEDSLLVESGGLLTPTLWHLALSPDTVVRTSYVQTDAGLVSAQVSRQRDLVVFQEGRGAIWIREYPNAGPPTMISSGSGSEPRWSPDGLSVYYWIRPVANGDWTLLAAWLRRSPAIAVTRTDTIYTTPRVRSWDIFPDGKRFLVAQPLVESTPVAPARREPFSMLTNFGQELKRLAPP